MPTNWTLNLRQHLRRVSRLRMRFKGGFRRTGFSMLALATYKDRKQREAEWVRKMNS
jgi:hypothetical protein